MFKDNNENTLKSKNARISKYYTKLDKQRVKCTLCPNSCVLKEGQVGFCNVRQNFDGDLYNLYYGLSTYFVVEPIETNAVFHYMPGQLALSCGSIGCNLDCIFCQAWRYGKNFQLKEDHYFSYCTPEEVVQKTKNLGLKVIAWTFNDPMSFFEFAMDTSRLAKKEGIKSVFKSNHYINPKPLLDIMEYIDVFSVSLKSINNEFYKNLCSGTIEPVLNAIKILQANKKRMEICNLVIPGHNNSTEDLTRLVKWIKETVGVNVPLHFARFHPDHKLTDVPRTPIEDIHRVVEIAKEHGFSYVYSGNIFIDPYLNTYCPKCNHILIERKGERSHIANKSKRTCDKCGVPLDIIFKDTSNENNLKAIYKYYNWKEDIWSFHLQVANHSTKPKTLVLEHQFSAPQSEKDSSIDILEIAPGEKIRYAVNRLNRDHVTTKIIHDNETGLNFFNNLDRAYYYWGD